MPNKIVAWLMAERSRWVLWLPVGLGLGIAAYFALPSEPPSILGWRVLSVSLLLAVLLRRRPFRLAAALGVAIISLGFAMAAWQTERVKAPILQREVSIRPIEGRIAEIVVKEEGSKLVLDAPVIEGMTPAETPRRISVSLRGYDASLITGDRVSLKAGLFPPPAPFLPGGYDFSRHFYFQGVGAVGYGIGTVKVVEKGDPSSPFLYRLAEWRRRLSEHIRGAMPSPYGALAAALVTGETASIPEEVSESMRVAGLSHVLAVSGMNLALVSGILFFMVRAFMGMIPPLAVRVNSKKWAALVALFGSLAYLGISGWPVSAQRAFAMIALLLLAVLLDREATPMRSIAWAATVILLIEPESLLGAGFQLSFAATLGLVAFYETAQPAIEKRLRGRRIAYYLAAALLSALVAGLATAPYTLYHFHQFSNYGILANVMVAPLISFVMMPSVVLALLLMPFGLEALALWPLEWGIKGMLWCAQWVQTLPKALIYLPPLPEWGVALITLGGLWLALWQSCVRYAGCALIVLGLLGLLTIRLPDALVSGDGKQIAVALGEEGSLVLLKGRKSQFGTEQWLRYFGQEEALTVKEMDIFPKDRRTGALHCDRQGCVFSKGGYDLAWLKDAAIAEEECARAQVIIADFPLGKECPRNGRQVIDATALKRYGAHAVWLRESAIHVERVRQTQGERPWSGER